MKTKMNFFERDVTSSLTRMLQFKQKLALRSISLRGERNFQCKDQVSRWYVEATNGRLWQEGQVRCLPAPRDSQTLWKIDAVPWNTNCIELLVIYDLGENYILPVVFHDFVIRLGINDRRANASCSPIVVLHLASLKPASKYRGIVRNVQRTSSRSSASFSEDRNPPNFPFN